MAKNVPLVTAKTLYDGADQIEFKIVETGTWDGYGVAAGTAAASANAEIAVIAGGDNIPVVAAEGAYDVYFDKANGKVWVMTPGYKPGDEVPGGEEPVVPEKPEIPSDLVAYTIWEGNFESGSWGGMQDLAYGQYDWSARKPGQYLRFTCAPTNSSADWVISLRVGTDWEHINGIPQQFYNNVYDLVVELTDEIIADLVARQGLIVQGDNVTVTKIELYRKEINTGGESDTIDNIVTNSSFEDGASGWMGWWSGYTQTIVDEGRNGGSALLCTLSETSANLWEAQLYWSLPSADYLQVGVTYAYEYYVKSDSALTVQFLAQKPSDGYPAVYGPDTFKAGEDWTLITGEFTYDGNPDSIDRVGIQFGGTPNAKLWVDDFIFGPKK